MKLKLVKNLNNIKLLERALQASKEGKLIEFRPDCIKYIHKDNIYAMCADIPLIIKELKEEGYEEI